MKGLRLALKTARESTHSRHALGAVVMKGGAVLAKAANGSRRAQCAERRALHRGQFVGSTLYVVRANGGCSKPCEECMRVIRDAGIRLVVYIGHDGSVGEVLV